MKNFNLYETLKEIQEETSSMQREKDILLLLEKFSPLIHKYKYLLHYEDAENDLITFFIEIILIIPLDKFKNKNKDYCLLSYISISMHNKYIKLSKKFQQENNTEPLEDWFIENSHNDLYEYEILDLLNHLHTREKQIIILKFWYGYSDIELGKIFHLTRQSIHRQTVNSLKKLQNLI